MKYLNLGILLFLVSYYTASAKTYNQERDFFVNKPTKMIYTFMQVSHGAIQYDTERSDSTEKTRVQPKESILIKLIGYFVVFCLGYLSAMMHFKNRIKGILKVEYDEYKTRIPSSEKKYPSFGFGVIKVLKESKNHYKNNGGDTSSQETKLNEKPILKPLNEQVKISQEQKSQPEKEGSAIHGQVSSNETSENIKNIETGSLNSKEEKVNILYFTIPEEDGSFLEDTASIIASPRSYYKIEFLEGDKTAKLIYRSGSLDPSALSKMDDILGPVCEIENTTLKSPTKINIESYGTVVKDDNKWTIKNKIKIKLT